jgi:CubicO group peptidase (beta-lactamase class C family)
LAATKAGALYSTVEDLYRWDQALSTNRLIAKPYVDRMFAAQVSMPVIGGIQYAYGCGAMRRSAYDRPVLFHAGELSGISTILARYPQDQLTIIILSNQSGDPGIFLKSMEKLIFSDQ